MGFAIGGAIIGAIGGAMGQHGSSHSSGSSGVDLAPASGLENTATTNIGNDYGSLQAMVNAGPGQQDVTNAYNQQGAYSSMLSEFARTGGAASPEDIARAQQQASLQFAPQQVALNQSFEQEQMRAKQLAAQLGRPINDAYIQAQLGKERMNSQQMLAANQGAFIGQQSQQNALSRLGYTAQLTDVQNSLASQAMANRQALLSIGQGIQGSERNFRLGTATRWGQQNGTTDSGGGLGGAISGGLAGAGMGMNFASTLGSSAPGAGQAGSVPVNTGMMYGPPTSMATFAQPTINPARSSRLLGNIAPMGSPLTSQDYNMRQSYGTNMFNNEGTGFLNTPGFQPIQSYR